jgi:SAM-dependent methyltransferase
MATKRPWVPWKRYTIVETDEALYIPKPTEPQNDLHWLNTASIPQSVQFMIDCLPTLRRLLGRFGRYDVPIRVLDVGTGSGAGASLLATLYSGQILGYTLKVDALDRAPHVQRYARAKFPLINYMIGEAWDLRGDRPWEVVICSHLIEHMDDPIGFARHLQSLASQWVLIYAPYNETNPIPGHKVILDDDLLAKMGAQDVEIIASPGWNPLVHKDPKCVLFTLPGTAGTKG